MLTRTYLPLTDAWTVTPVDGPTPSNVTTTPIPAVVPGVIHTDLLRAGLIADPFDGDNEADQQWIGDTTWRYATSFTWSRADAGASGRHDLVADGLDTVATIVLNGVTVAQTENQHRSYRFDIGALLREGENELAITFAAPVPETLARAEKYGAKPRVNHHEYNQLRKTACHFGWDWGVDVAGCGIWRPIGIESWQQARIASVRPLVDVETSDEGHTGVLTAHVAIEREQGYDAPVPLSVRVGEVTATGLVPAGESSTTVELRVPDAALWWPAGHGEQPLHDVVVELGSEGRASWEGRVGFRTVAVDTCPDEHGIPFTVLVNGQRILIRGVNWIPDHAFLTEISAERYAARLTDALDAHVNLIRVWGGGIYESDDFYDFADEHGLLVWQDFLFACAAYAEEDHLSAEVEAEAREQITRLSSHPSLAIWNGNNENTWGWADWGWRHQVGAGTWGKGYYEELLPGLLAELDPTRPYSPASPYSFGDFLHPNDPSHGTMHIWDVWNRRDYTVYRDYDARFVSEFGWQGPPAWSTLAGVVHDEPMDPYGHQMLVHQKANFGNLKLQRGQRGHLPDSTTIEHWHWATQLNQAHAIRFGVEHFRSLTPLNTGTVLWQLNDNWPVVSWAAVDFFGHRKPLWHALKAAYAPRLGTIQPRASQQSIADAFEGVAPVKDVLAYVLVNDTAEAIADATLTVRRVRFDGTVLASLSMPLSVAARDAVAIELPASVATLEDAAGELLVAEVSGAEVERALWNGAEVVDQALVTEPLTASVRPVDVGYVVEVEASGYVRDLVLQVDRLDPTATVDRGMVSLLPGERVGFVVRTAQQLDPAALTGPLVLRHANQLLAAQS